MNLKSKVKLILLLSITFIILLSAKIFAASISVSPSTSSVSPGGTFTVTISGSDATGRVNISASNGSVSQSSVWVENNSQSVTVTAGSSGTVTVSASGEVSTNAGEDVNVSRSTSVKINTPSSGGGAQSGGSSSSSSNSGSSNSSSGSSSSNNSSTVSAPTLSNLGINPHDFSGFSAGRTSYTVNVPNDCTSINLYANSKNGTVSGTGTKNLKEGTNKFTVTVSNSGGSKTYTVSVVRATAAGEDVPNVVDEPQVENEPTEGIGLKTLTLGDYKLDKEFKTDTYEYMIQTKEDVTLEILNSIKEKIVAESNFENDSVEISNEISEDVKGKIIIIFKDEEKEYAKYFINVVKEEEKKEAEPAIVGSVTNNNNNSNNSKSKMSLKNISFKSKVLIVLGIYMITLCAAIVFAFLAYKNSKKLREFEEEYEIVDEENEDLQTIERKEDLSNLSTASNKDAVIGAEKKLNKYDGYRNLRTAPEKNSGRHF